MSEIVNIGGREVRRGLSIKDCKVNGFKPSMLRPELDTPLFNDWDFIIRVANMGIAKGDLFTENDQGMNAILAFLVVMFGGETKKDFLAQSSEVGQTKLPSS